MWNDHVHFSRNKFPKWVLSQMLHQETSMETHWGPIKGFRLADYGHWGSIIGLRLTDYGHWGPIIGIILTEYSHWGLIIGIILTE